MKNRLKNFKNIFKYNFIIIISLLIVGTISAYAFSFRNMTLDFIHISDSHISINRNDTSYKALHSSSALLRNAVSKINNITSLDFVLFTGDLVDSATEENYLEYYKILSKMSYPSLNAFGNHDFNYGSLSKDEVLDIVRKYNPNYTFADSYYAFSPKTDYRIIILDGVMIDNQKTSNGNLTEEQLRFLDNELSQNQDKIAIIALHFPPVEPFASAEHCLLNADRFNDILVKYKNPIMVLSGHYHATKIRRIGNIVYVSTPSLVTYPMAFRHIKIVNYRDRVYYKFSFISTDLSEIKEENRKNVISYATLAGKEIDRDLEFTYFKKHHKSTGYKKRKIANASKTTKVSKREIKKLQEPKTIKTKNKAQKTEKKKLTDEEKALLKKQEKELKEKQKEIEQPKIISDKKQKLEKTKKEKTGWNLFNKKQKTAPEGI